MRAFVCRWVGTGAGWQAFPANLVYYSGGWRTTGGFGIVSLGSKKQTTRRNKPSYGLWGVKVCGIL